MTTDTNQRVQRHRDALRRAGLRPLQIWVADTRRPGFREECLRQSLSLSADPQEADVLTFLEYAADRDGWR